jgi:hypothetical protein
MTTESEPITPLLAGMDTVYFSCDLPLSDAIRERLTQEKAAAQARAAQRQVHCPEWLEAHIAPQGAKGGYAFLIETEDFSVKLLGEHIQNRPNVFIEMRSLPYIPIPKAQQAHAKRRWPGSGRICMLTRLSPPRTRFPSVLPRSHAPISISIGRVATRPCSAISQRSSVAS